ncbi:MAG: hypothetical protein ACE5JS_14105 [Nitrospinota bacterium]
MQAEHPQNAPHEESSEQSMTKTIPVDIVNLEKQLHEATQGKFTWCSDEPPRLGGEENHPQPLTYLTAGIGQ